MTNASTNSKANVAKICMNFCIKSPSRSRSKNRILVLCGGKANGMLDARTTTKEEVGLRMTNLVQKEGK